VYRHCVGLTVLDISQRLCFAFFVVVKAAFVFMWDILYPCIYVYELDNEILITLSNFAGLKENSW